MDKPWDQPPTGNLLPLEMGKKEVVPILGGKVLESWQFVRGHLHVLIRCPLVFQFILGHTQIVYLCS